MSPIVSFHESSSVPNNISLDFTTYVPIFIPCIGQCVHVCLDWIASMLISQKYCTNFNSASKCVPRGLPSEMDIVRPCLVTPVTLYSCCKICTCIHVHSRNSGWGLAVGECEMPVSVCETLQRVWWASVRFVSIRLCCWYTHTAHMQTQLSTSSHKGANSGYISICSVHIEAWNRVRNFALQRLYMCRYTCSVDSDRRLICLGEIW